MPARRRWSRCLDHREPCVDLEVVESVSRAFAQPCDCSSMRSEGESGGHGLTSPECTDAFTPTSSVTAPAKRDTRGAPPPDQERPTARSVRLWLLALFCSGHWRGGTTENDRQAGATLTLEERRDVCR